ncbi:hypothetical protein ACIRPK_26890 [Kitasatospora sp. NPDC101801]|uniref:hypothetical protein n=1 Tax=Kitasatospora sp. NPDC101801 TaxID=3364103 RepID=UPI0038094837
MGTHWWASGDGFYACPGCRELVDSSDWPRLIAYADLGSRGAQVTKGFRTNHVPSAIAFEPGSNPETGRSASA